MDLDRLEARKGSVLGAESSIIETIGHYLSKFEKESIIRLYWKNFNKCQKESLGTEHSDPGNPMKFAPNRMMPRGFGLERRSNQQVKGINSKKLNKREFPGVSSDNSGEGTG
jgi:hypothetical protein